MLNWVSSSQLLLAFTDSSYVQKYQVSKGLRQIHPSAKAPHHGCVYGGHYMVSLESKWS
jgi:hypothetical protein